MPKKKDVIPDFRNGVNKHPHVVILGAGASLATCPDGDKFGRKLPLMNSLVQILNLENDLKGFESSFNNFESLYTALCEKLEYRPLRELVEERTYRYFYEMEIPDKPILYDYLILSLRKKDVIATFNWDPLLLKAWRRHTKFLPHLPMILFLHGNVAVGVCKNCNAGGYMYAGYCNNCKNRLVPSRLLYPVERKDYNSDEFIKRQWTTLEKYLKYSYYVTIFGYSAPTTDVEARKLMLKAIKANRSNMFSELDIINTTPRKQLEANWHDFFYSHHFGINKTLRSNHLLQFPRRSCDAHASAYLMNDPWSTNKMPTFRSIESMQDWIEPLIKEEIEFEKSGKGFSSERVKW